MQPIVVHVSLHVMRCNQMSGVSAVTVDSYIVVLDCTLVQCGSINAVRSERNCLTCNHKLQFHERESIFRYWCVLRTLQK